MDVYVKVADLFNLGNPEYKNTVVISYMKNAPLPPAVIAFLQITVEGYARF